MCRSSDQQVYSSTSARLGQLLAIVKLGKDKPVEQLKLHPAPPRFGLFQSTLHPRCMLETVHGRSPGLHITDLCTFGKAVKGGKQKSTARYMTKLLYAIDQRSELEQLIGRTSTAQANASATSTDVNRRESEHVDDLDGEILFDYVYRLQCNVAPGITYIGSFHN